MKIFDNGFLYLEQETILQAVSDARYSLPVPEKKCCKKSSNYQHQLVQQKKFVVGVCHFLRIFQVRGFYSITELVSLRYLYKVIHLNSR